MANTESTNTRLTATLGELLGNRLEALRQPVEIRDTEIAEVRKDQDNMNTTKNTSTKKTSKKTSKKVDAAPAERVAAPIGSGASTAIKTHLLGELLAATKTTVAAAGGSKKEQARIVEKTMAKAERKILTLDSCEHNGTPSLALNAPFSNGFLKLASEAGIERDFVKAEGVTYVPASQKAKLLKVLKAVWSYGGSVLVVDGAEPLVLPRHDAAVAEFKASKGA